MVFSLDEYRTAVAQYEEMWRVLDSTLYRLCREHPGHRSWDGLCAKLWIIGRSYTTGIERSIISKGTQGSSLSQLADRLHEVGGEADRIVNEIREVVEPPNAEKAARIVGLHGQFANLITPITRGNQSPRSFISKYLHFHAPAVPIIDSYADRILPPANPGRRTM